MTPQNSMIQNFKDLATDDKKRDCLKILNAGLEAARPKNAIPRFVTSTRIKIKDKTIKFSDYTAVYTVAFGKAADTMTQSFNSIHPVNGGIIVIPKGSRSVLKGKKFQIFNSRHPKPDKTSVKAAKEIVKFVQNKKSGELIVFLISGGASSLLALPDQITLEDKIHVTDVMLKSGATIQEVNCIRKHLSKIKGGRLVKDIKCTGIGLIMSDVEGDDISTIASGMTHTDDTTYTDTLDILAKYKLKRKMPKEVIQVLQNGIDTHAEPRIENFVIANNESCILEMKQMANKLGYKVSTMQVFGDIKEAVKKILENINEDQKQCLIFGGETTVKVLGKGAGGRNQELVLRLLKNTQKRKHLVIASMGTDGIDGNSVFAGAITENVKTDLNTIKEFLRDNDSARFFQKQNKNIVTNFTHTNLMDIGMILT